MNPVSVGVQVRNAFCAIRPPGHHAGPTGVVTCANDPAGSHGFCLLNNIAIAAAYAMNAHRHAGEPLHTRTVPHPYQPLTSPAVLQYSG